MAAEGQLSLEIRVTSLHLALQESAGQVWGLLEKLWGEWGRVGSVA